MCSIQGCSAPGYAKGFCTKHYQRFRTHGDPSVNLNRRVFTPNPELVTSLGVRAMDLPVRPGYERLAHLILMRSEMGDEGCWMWTGALSAQGYGSIRAPKGTPKTSTLVHRALYTALYEDPAAGLHLDHLCRNRACCNPGHLDLVAPRVNLTRGLGCIAEKARAKFCIAGHRFDDANTYVTKRGSRSCRKCNARRARETKARRLARLSGAPPLIS